MYQQNAETILMFPKYTLKHKHKVRLILHQYFYTAVTYFVYCGTGAEQNWPERERSRTTVCISVFVRGYTLVISVGR
jgi:hypothetical protein